MENVFNYLEKYRFFNFCAVSRTVNLNGSCLACLVVGKWAGIPCCCYEAVVPLPSEKWHMRYRGENIITGYPTTRAESGFGCVGVGANIPMQEYVYKRFAQERIILAGDTG